MKRIFIIISILFTVVSQAQIVATANPITTGKWYFVYEHTDAYRIAPGVYNKILEVKWEERDTITSAVIKIDIFTHRDSIFNTFYNGYNDFYWLYKELADKEGLPLGDQVAIDAMFLNVAVPKTTVPLLIRH